MPHTMQIQLIEFAIHVTPRAHLATAAGITLALLVSSGTTFICLQIRVMQFVQALRLLYGV